MYSKTARRGAPPVLAAALIAAALLAGCGTSNPVAKTQTPAAGSSNGQSSGGMTGMNMNGGGSSSTANPPSVNGIKPVASQVLATTDWQGMKIQARTMTPTTFVTPTGSGGWTEIKASKKDSFHLMIMLNDAHTGEPIPYATVWATIRQNGKVVFDERQWPMLSAYMGPHYGNNVVLPGPGKYTLTLLISPPEAARHLEYKNVWLKPHRITETFTWNGSS